ncbi:11729_t:CDS:2 [Paraglomus brasilianum]|uniref:11729_t:CDS:1 n=1 Tax=Paraglomus brasilianum TaxID=144538 RepID=A0A9N9FLP5_9GLOM|nr:11729_t:CDS:2 [Paraglomus brasilianum]
MIIALPSNLLPLYLVFYAKPLLQTILVLLVLSYILWYIRFVISLAAKNATSIPTEAARRYLIDGNNNVLATNLKIIWASARVLSVN